MEIKNHAKEQQSIFGFIKYRTHKRTKAGETYMYLSLFAL